MNRTKTQRVVRYCLMCIVVALAMVLIGASLIMVMRGFGASPASAASNPPLIGLQAPTNLLQSANATLPRTITVVGEGSINLDPDIATTNIGIDIRDDDVKSANDEASEVMTRLIAALKARGIDDSDIQTAGYNIWIEQGFSPSLMTTQTNFIALQVGVQ